MCVLFDLAILYIVVYPKERIIYMIEILSNNVIRVLFVKTKSENILSILFGLYEIA